MFYALIIVCALAEPWCDAEHAAWADQSAPLFDDMDECFDAAELHLKLAWDETEALASVGSHRTLIFCTEATRPS